jgi:hypothetical protein
MSATIGSVSVDYVYGTPVAAETGVELLQAAGVPGYGVRLAAARSRSAALQVHHYADDLTAAATLLTDLAALVGTLVTVTLNNGQTFANCLVAATRPEGVPKQVAVDETLKYRVTVIVDVVQQASEG